MVTKPPIELVSVSTRGVVSQGAVEQAKRKVSAALAHAPGKVLGARVSLHRQPNPAVCRPAIAKAAVDVEGRQVRAHVGAEEMNEAIDLLDARLRGQLRVLGERLRSRHRRTGIPTPGEWRHGDRPTERPTVVARPPEERQIVRRKTFDPEPVSREEAVFDMLLADWDFYLFVDSAGCGDAIVHRADDGPIRFACTGRADEGGATTPLAVDPLPPTLSERSARARLDSGLEPFVFFCAEEDGRGRVLYRRYDGHYGLIEPAASPPAPS